MSADISFIKIRIIYDFILKIQIGGYTVDYNLT